ncbi:MAG: hypothetical protein AVDCRST_MAG04-2321, partial [uncultured Acetobacteraceae bacterium]
RPGGGRRPRPAGAARPSRRRQRQLPRRTRSAGRRAHRPGGGFRQRRNPHRGGGGARRPRRVQPGHRHGPAARRRADHPRRKPAQRARGDREHADRRGAAGFDAGRAGARADPAEPGQRRRVPCPVQAAPAM